MRSMSSLNLRQRITLMIAALLIVSVALIGGVVYFQAKKMVVDSIGTQVAQIAEKAEKLIETGKYQKMLESNGADTSYYVPLRMKLNDIREKTGLLYLYTMQQVGDRYIYIVDGQSFYADEEEVSAYGAEEDEITPEMEVAFAGQTIIGDLQDSEDWGQTLSAYVPIIGSEGQVLGIVGADFLAEGIYQMLHRSLNLMLAILGAVLVLGLGASYLIARSISRPLEELVITSEMVRDGNLAVQLHQPKRQDEVGKLYRSFAEMVENLRSLVEKIQERYSRLENSVRVLDESAGSTEQSMAFITSSVNDVAAGSENQVTNLSEARVLRAIVSRPLNSQKKLRNGRQQVGRYSEVPRPRSVRLISRLTSRQRLSVPWGARLVKWWASFR